MFRVRRFPFSTFNFQSKLMMGWLEESQSQLLLVPVLGSFQRTRLYSKERDISVTASLLTSSLDPSYSSSASGSNSNGYLNANGVGVGGQVGSRRDRDSVPSELQDKLLTVRSGLGLMDVVEKVPKGTLSQHQCIDAIMDTLGNLLKGNVNPNLDEKKEILNSVGMQRILREVRAQVRWMSPKILITVTKALVLLETPSRHPTLLSVLHLLSKQANSLTLSEIMYLHFLVERVGETPLRSALLLALPVVFESQLSVQMSPRDLRSAVDYLHYATRTGMSEGIVEKIGEGILGSVQHLEVKEALSVIWSLADYKRGGLGGEDGGVQSMLLGGAMEILVDRGPEVGLDRLNTTLQKLAKRVVKQGFEFYNSELVEGVIQRVLSEEGEKERWSSGLMIPHILRSALLMRHVNIDLIENVTERVLMDPSLLLNSDKFYDSFVRYLSGANYKPEKWELLSSLLLEHPLITAKELDIQVISLALDFLALGLFPESLISRIFSPAASYKLDEFVQKYSAYQPLLIASAVITLHPNYSGPLPSPSTIAGWRSSIESLKFNYPIKPWLGAIFGDSNFVVSGLFVHGFHVEYAIVLDSEGRPIQVASFEPDLWSRLKPTLPPGSQLVLLKTYGKEGYALNTSRLRGIYVLLQKVLEGMGFPTVVVDTTNFIQLPDSEKVAYLTHRISEKVGLRID